MLELKKWTCPRCATLYTYNPETFNFVCDICLHNPWPIGFWVGRFLNASGIAWICYKLKWYNPKTCKCLTKQQILNEAGFHIYNLTIKRIKRIKNG